MKSVILNSASRRLFLKQSAAVAGLGAGAPLALNLAAMGSAAAQTATDYKALVCIFLTGGNDAYNTVLATDPSSWQAYATVRAQAPSPLVLPRDGVLPLNPVKALAAGRSLALHPQLKDLQTLFNTHRRLAIVSNVGPLIEPLTKAEYRQFNRRLPAKLFSHNDQQSTWQALGPEGAGLGWGGRLADMVASNNSTSLFTGITASGNAVWLSGEKTRQYHLLPSGVSRIGVVTNEFGVDHIYGSPQVAAAMERIVSGTRGGSKFEADLSSVAQRSIAAQKIIGSALPSAEEAPYGPSANLLYNAPAGGKTFNPLAQQLQAVARCIGTHQSLGLKRQVFFVSLGGFDTHDEQNARQADLLARLNHAMAYFDTVLSDLGMADRVTTFTASDFGRTFTSNGDGTDHGWGSHHFVMGGAVNGGAIVGDIPVYGFKNSNSSEFDSSPDQLLNGVLLPKISVEQYGASLGAWFGAGSNLATVFPNLRNFSSTSLQLMR